MSVTSIRIVGVGGQGIILASNLLSEVALAAGLEVKKAEAHGMSQRGGSVTSDVRFGDVVHSPIIGVGDVDLLVAFERLEALRALPVLKPGAAIVLNRQSIAPMPVLSGKAQYRADIEQTLAREAGRLIPVDGPLIADALGEPRVINSAVLGALSTLLPFSDEQWRAAYEQRLKKKGLEVNLRAFEEGKNQAAAA